MVSLHPVFRPVEGVGVGVCVLDNVGTDGCLEDIGQGVGVLAGSPIGADDGNSGTRHLDNCVVSRYGAKASNRRLVAQFRKFDVGSFSSHCKSVGAARAHGNGTRRRTWRPSLESRLDTGENQQISPSWTACNRLIRTTVILDRPFCGHM